MTKTERHYRIANQYSLSIVLSTDIAHFENLTNLKKFANFQVKFFKKKEVF